jgi:NAD(P)-dependent dehydrogenase (short-subunit alcohol dehydrogenase family)
MNNIFSPDNDEPPVILVLGATGGIGSEVCRRLSAQGASLVVGARGEDRLRSLARDLNAYAITVDATDSEKVDNFFDRAVEFQGRVDGVVNCVGSILLKPAHCTTDAEWASTIATNLTSAFSTLRAATREMEGNGGSIVLMSSVAASIGLANHEAIAAAKAGINGLVLSAAATYARQGIRVNAVAPGLVRTPLTHLLTENPMMLKASTAMYPLGRIGEAGDVASAIVWLLDRQQSWVTGQIINVDGGMSSVRGR